MKHELAVVLVLALGLAGCQLEDDHPANPPVAPGNDADSIVEPSSIVGIPYMYIHFESQVDIRRVGDFIELKSDGEPSHSSPYFPSTDSRYEAPPPGWSGNPNKIREQDFVFLVPANPMERAVATDTPMGPIGIAVNGVALHNEYAFNGTDDASTESDTFDAYNGHPTGMPEGMYHYHMRPKAIVGVVDADKLVGVMLDGFPLYGPLAAPARRRTHTETLDSRHGHFCATPDFPSGIYHYHVTVSSPYFCGAFAGTPGTVTN